MVTQSNLVAFIIGAGSHIGAAAAAQLHANGYKVALGNRSAGPEYLPEHDKVEDPYFHVKIDVSRRETIDCAFDDLVAQLGPINVVIYNGLSLKLAILYCGDLIWSVKIAASLAVPPIQSDILSLSVNDYYDSISVGLGVFAVAKKALTSGFRDSLHRTNPKTFIVTGNILPFTQYTPATFFTLGSQKAVAARFIATAARTYGLTENIK